MIRAVCKQNGNDAASYVGKFGTRDIIRRGEGESKDKCRGGDVVPQVETAYVGVCSMEYVHEVTSEFVVVGGKGIGRKKPLGCGSHTGEEVGCDLFPVTHSLLP